jgi:hypothetical protein
MPALGGQEHMRLLFILLACAALGVATQASSIEVQFYYGVEARNKLDTIRGTFTKDMVCDSSITIPFDLTQTELASIFAKADSIGFFQMPANIVIEHPRCWLTPCSKFYLRIKTYNTDHSVSWDNCFCEEGSVLMELRTFIIEVIESRREYRVLPKARWQYR